MLTRYLAALLLCASLLAGPAIAQQEAATEQTQADTETPQVQPVPETAETQPAETQPAAPSMPKAEPVLQHVPADAIVFVVVNDISAVTADVDKYLTEVGLAPLLADRMPNGLLDAIKSAFRLGEGFNANGGVAAALLPLEKYGVDLDKLMAWPGKESPQGESAQESQPAAAGPEQKLPFLLLVPGTGVQEVFGSYEQAPSGKYTEVLLRMGKMLAVQVGGYVALSPRADVLDSLTTAESSIASKLTKEQAEFVARSLIAVHADFAAASGTMEMMFKKLQENLAHFPGGSGRAEVARGLGPMLQVQQQQLSQLDSATVGLRFVETGLVYEAMASLKPDSQLGKALATIVPPAFPPLNRLPNLPYVVAFGYSGSGKALSEAQQGVAFDILDKMKSSGAFPKMDEETLRTLKELAGVMYEEVTELQFVAGGAPEGSGLLAMAAVIRCNNSARVKDAIVDKAPAMINRLIEKVAKEGQQESTGVEEPALQQQPQDDPPQEGAEAKPLAEANETQATQQPAESQPETEPGEAAPAPETAEAEPTTAPAESKVKLVVSKAAESIDNVPVDVVEITLPADAQEQAGQQLTTMLGEDKLRIFVVAPDDKTLVVTLGGAKAFLAEAVKTAKAADGNILATEGAIEAMKYMPKNAVALGLLNVGNLFDLIAKIAAAMAPEQGQALPFQITVKTPIAFGSSVTGATQHVAFYVPTELVKEVSGIIGMFMGRGMRQPPREGQSEQDF